MKTDKLSEQIHRLRDQAVLKYKDEKLPFFKRIAHRLFGWYVDPIGEAVRETNQKLAEILDELISCVDELEKKNEDLRGETVQKLSELTARVTDIEAREQWVRERFDGQDRRFESGEQFQDWARGRCDGLEQRIADIEGREEWTRNSFDRVNSRIDLFPENSGKSTFSQSGEDIIVDYVLRFLKTDISKVKYLDLGANHAKEMSNSYRFYCSGASGVLVEANPELIGELTSERPRDTVLNNVIAFTDEPTADFYVLSGDGLSCVDLESAEEACRANPEISIKAKYTVPTVAVMDIIKTYFPEKRLDILSIDLEGIEDKVLENFDFSEIRPKAVILENIEYHPYLVCEKRPNGKVERILADNGYKEYAFTGINSIYLDMQMVEAVNEGIKKDLGIGE